MKQDPAFAYMVMAIFREHIECMQTQVSADIVTFLSGERPTR